MTLVVILSEIDPFCTPTIPTIRNGRSYDSNVGNL